jgi:phage head maturation protease
LASHDYLTPPIGKVISVEPDEGGLVAAVVFDPDDPLAQTVQRKYEQGYLHAVSVGLNPLRVEPATKTSPMRIVEAELLEISSVSVPADADATLLQKLQTLAQRPANATPRAAPDLTDPATLRRIEACVRRLQLNVLGKQLAARLN